MAFPFGSLCLCLGLGLVAWTGKGGLLKEWLGNQIPLHGFCIGPLLFDVGPSVAVLDLGLGSELGQSGVRHVVMIDR